MVPAIVQLCDLLYRPPPKFWNAKKDKSSPSSASPGSSRITDKSAVIRVEQFFWFAQRAMFGFGGKRRVSTEFPVFRKPHAFANCKPLILWLSPGPIGPFLNLVFLELLSGCASNRSVFRFGRRVRFRLVRQRLSFSPEFRLH
jgi:hypothetical protein